MNKLKGVGVEQIDPLECTSVTIYCQESMEEKYEKTRQVVTNSIAFGTIKVYLECNCGNSCVKPTP